MSQYAGPAQEQPPAAPASVRVSIPTSRPYATYAIIAVTSLIYLVQYLSPLDAAGTDWLERLGALMPGAIRAGQLWRFLTPILLHASIPHIAFNMYAVWIFGVGLERHFGRWRFLVLYLLGGFTGNVVSFLHLPSDGLSVGASTAIFGLIGAEAVFLLQNRRLFGNQFRAAITNVIVIVAANLGLDAFIPAIDIWGHVGGLVGGLLFTWLAGPIWRVEQSVDASSTLPTLRLVDARDPRMVVTGAALVVMVFGALATVGLVHPLVP